MKSSRAALALLVVLGGCSRRNVEVDPQFDCGDPALIDVDQSCDGRPNASRCVVGDAIHDAGDQKLRTLERVTGTLTITGREAVEATQLRAVGGCLVVATEGATTVTFPSLVEVARLRITDLVVQQVQARRLRRGDVDIVGGDLTALALPGHTSGRITLRETLGLQAVSAATITGGVVVDGAPDLIDLTLPALLDADRVEVTGTGLSTLSLPALTHIGRLVVVDNLALAAIALPALVQVEEELTITGNGPAADDDVCALAALVSADEAFFPRHDATCP